MATTKGVTGSIALTGTFAEKKTSASNTDPLTVGVSVSIKQTDKYTAGTGALQCDAIYGQEVTISTPTTFDLADVGNPFGRVREILVVNTDATNPVKIYAAASGGWAFLPPQAEALVIQPNNGHLAITDPSTTGSGAGGMEVTSSPAKVVLDPNGETVSVSFAFVGASVA